jgi:phosphoribosylanthranilate isomerase
MTAEKPMHRTRIKICGITRPEDAAAAVNAGADAIGMVFALSSRQVTLEQAAAIAAAVPPPVARIGVFVDAGGPFVADAVAAGKLTSVQFCGDESPAQCMNAPVECIKVLRVGTEFGWSAAEPFRGLAAALLLDTQVTGKAGGTAKTFAWHSVGEAPGWARVFVAGGLNPSNVGEVIAALHPFGVDVSSGVESTPGIKDHALIEAFVAAVHAADQEVYGR